VRIYSGILLASSEVEGRNVHDTFLRDLIQVASIIRWGRGPAVHPRWPKVGFADSKPVSG